MLWQILLLELLLLSGDIRSASAGSTCVDFATCSAPYVVVLEADSAGTQAFVYQLKRGMDHCDKVVGFVSEKNSKKTDVGIASLIHCHRKVDEHLDPLIDFAISQVPEDLQPLTPIFLAATDGVRGLTRDQQQLLMCWVSAKLKKSPFALVAPSSDQPPGSAAASFVLSENEEAYYTLLMLQLVVMGSKNWEGGIMYRSWQRNYQSASIKIGSESTQIAVVKNSTRELPLVSWRRANKADVFVESSMGLGKSAAALSILGYREGQQLEAEYKSSCLNPNFTGTFSYNSVTINVTGDPSIPSADRWSSCQAKVREFFRSNRHRIPRAPTMGPYSPRTYFVKSDFSNVFEELKRLGVPMRGSDQNLNSETVPELERKAASVCNDPLQYSRPYFCLDSAYILTLLAKDLAIPDNFARAFPNSIRNFTMGWPLGMAAVLANSPNIPCSSCIGF